MAQMLRRVKLIDRDNKNEVLRLKTKNNKQQAWPKFYQFLQKKAIDIYLPILIMTDLLRLQ